MSKDPKAYNNILELIGNTPLIKLNCLTKDYPGSYYTKYEAYNPGHSNKDRIALHILNQAEKNGILKKGSTIIETTSGNTGFSLAMVSLLKGYKCILAVSSKASKDKINMMNCLGAEIYVCPSNVASDDPRSYYEVAKRLNKEIKNSVYINQYFNELNVEAHYKGTGPEIWNQTKGKITHLIACSGTGGTISGIGSFLKEQNRDIKIIGVDAYGSILKKYHETGEIDPKEIYSYRIEGLGKNIVPSATDFKIIDKFVKVTDSDSAHMAREITIKEGLFVGYTSGAAFQAVNILKDENEFTNDSLVVIIFPDHGSRYLSKIYSDEWMNNQGFYDSAFYQPKKNSINYI
ncbi:MAG: pyridoxal-phosphate dependent enzyme [Flavobacteriales bacterium]|nr:MAG: pyridoxal-phosphate dependent enzyme [Flavobacteriales bacterium]